MLFIYILKKNFRNKFVKHQTHGKCLFHRNKEKAVHTKNCLQVSYFYLRFNPTKSLLHTCNLLTVVTQINQNMKKTEISLKKENTSNSIKVFKKRWVILLIYMLYATANAFQWMEYSIIANIIMRFYKVSSTDADWTSIIYMLLYPVIVIPLSYLIDKKGLRFASLCGGIGTAIAAFVKIFSVQETLFFVVIIGQGIGSAAQVFVLCLPSKIAAVWFKPNEVSTACSLAVLGTEIGLALGFVIPSSIVKNHEDLALVQLDLRNLCWLIAIYMVPVVLAIIFFFPNQPLTPPSIAQLQKRNQKTQGFRQYLICFLRLFRNRGFALHTVAYGINMGVIAAIGTMLNQFILEYFPNSEEDAGRIGLITIIGGMVGSLLFGIFLDRTHKYKETTVFICYAAVVSVMAAMFSLLTYSKILVYIAMGTVGFFANGYMPVGFEFAVEITYPADETTTTGILNATAQAMGVLITLFLGYFNAYFGAFWGLGSQALLLLIGAIITSFVPNDKRRQNIFKIQYIKDNELKLFRDI